MAGGGALVPETRFLEVGEGFFGPFAGLGEAFGFVGEGCDAVF